MHPDLDRILISRDQIQRRVGELGAQIAADYAGRELLLTSPFDFRRQAKLYIETRLGEPNELLPFAPAAAWIR